MKKVIVYPVIFVVLLLIYFLFEPIFNYSFGWKDLPQEGAETGYNLNSNAAFARSIYEAEKILATAKEELQAPALSVAVGINNQLIWARALGYSDLDKRQKANTNTSFRIGSTSKAVSSVALGKLLEEDKLELDSPVQQYVSYISNIKIPISIRQIASHTSGIRNYSTCLCLPIWEYYSNDYFASVQESVEVFQYDDLMFEPGSQYSYSSYNYNLLSAAIEEVTDQSFTDYLNTSIFKPLGMKNTAPDYANSTMENRALLYEVKDGQYKQAFDVDNSNKWAGGGLISSPSDLVKLGNALLNETLLSKRTVDILFSPQKLNDGSINEEGYALGWRSSREQKIFSGEQLAYAVHHGGVAMGSTSFLILFPDYNLTISLLMNKNAPEKFRDFSKYTVRIAEHFIKEIEKNQPNEILP